jgi:hypothetical protein
MKKTTKTNSRSKTNPTLLALTALLAVTACSKTVTETKYIPAPSANPVSINPSKSDIDSLRMLLSSKAPNLALAELLSRSVAREHQAEIRRLFADLSPAEANAIISRVETDNKNIRKNYLYRGQVYKDNFDLINSSLINPENFKDHNFSVETQLRNTAFAYIKSKALDEIISTYDKRANELAIELANDIAMDIGQSYKEDARKIEEGVKNSSKEEMIQMISKAKPVVEKIDQYFRSSKLNENEQYVVTITGIIAGSVYMQVKDKESFKRILSEGKRIARDINEFKAKANEFIFLVNTLEGHLTKTGKDFKDLGEGMNGARKDLGDLFKQVKPGSSDVHSRRIVDFLHGSIISGKKIKPDGTNESIFSKQVSFNDNFNKSVKAAASLTSNLSAILQTTQAMTSLLGIKPSKDLANVLDKAQKVSAVISTVQSAVAGFASGGFIGAMGAIGSGPLMSMMGGGGKSQDSAKLDEISRKLDMVLKNQQIMMKMQVETMNMIKELALMVDEYHQQEMTAIAELRDYSLVTLEMQKATLNKDIRSCEKMIEYQLASVWKSFNFTSGSFYNINNLDFINEKFTTSISGLQDIRRIMTSVEEDGFKKCQAGVAEAFGGNNSEENPIRALFASDENQNLFKFQRETYSPLVTTLEYIADTSDFDSLPLHVPAATYDSLKYKRPYVANAGRAERSNDVYDMNYLISVKNLERYLSHLILLHPLLDLDKSVWQKSYEEIVTTYIENSNTENNQNTRSQYFLNNALKMVQSAIAQESLLAGEPILEKLQDSYIDDVFSATQCDAVKRTDVPEPESISFFCALRNNRLLMKNLLQLHLNKKLNVEFMDKYRVAIETSNKEAIAKLLDMGLTPDRIEISKNRDGNGNDVSLSVLNVKKEKVSVKLPSLEALKEGKILYSENMPRLLKMQNLIVDGLEKVAPVKRDHKDKDLLKLLLVGV